MEFYNSKQYKSVALILEEQEHLMITALENMGKEITCELEYARELLAIAVEEGMRKVHAIVKTVEEITSAIMSDFVECRKDKGFEEASAYSVYKQREVLESYLFSYTLDFIEGYRK